MSRTEITIYPDGRAYQSNKTWLIDDLKKKPVKKKVVKQVKLSEEIGEFDPLAQ